MAWLLPGPASLTFPRLPPARLSSQIIHIIFVWPILWTGYVLLCYIPPYVTTPWLVVDQALLAMISYVFFYMVLEVKNHKALSGMGALAVSEWGSRALLEEAAGSGTRYSRGRYN